MTPPAKLSTTLAAGLLLLSCGDQSEPPEVSDASPNPAEQVQPNRETAWTVSSVSGSTLLVYRIPGDTPQTGQGVRVTFTIPGADSPIARAEGEIAEINAETFTIAIDPASQTGAPQPGDRITLLTP